MGLSGGVAEIMPQVVHRVVAGVVEDDRLVAVGAKGRGTTRVVLVDDRCIPRHGSWADTLLARLVVAPRPLCETRWAIPHSARPSSAKNPIPRARERRSSQGRTELRSSHDHSVPAGSDWSQPLMWSYGS